MIEFDKKIISDWTRMGMRKAYGPILETVAVDHSNLVALTADVADSANLIQFSRKFPDQF